jgi:hypothetical protein
MPYGLTIGTDRAASLQVAYLTDIHASRNWTDEFLQKAIEDELVVRGYSAEPGEQGYDTVEYMRSYTS